MKCLKARAAKTPLERHATFAHTQHGLQRRTQVSSSHRVVFHHHRPSFISSHGGHVQTLHNRKFKDFCWDVDCSSRTEMLPTAIQLSLSFALITMPHQLVPLRFYFRSSSPVSLATVVVLKTWNNDFHNAFSSPVCHVLSLLLVLSMDVRHEVADVLKGCAALVFQHERTIS